MLRWAPRQKRRSLRWAPRKHQWKRQTLRGRKSGGPQRRSPGRSGRRTRSVRKPNGQPRSPQRKRPRRRKPRKRRPRKRSAEVKRPFVSSKASTGFVGLQVVETKLVTRRNAE